MSKIIEIENWYDISEYESLYQITKKSEIKAISNPKSIASLMGKNGTTILKQQTSTKGYKKVLLTKNGKRKTLLVHRLMAMTFIPNPENKPTVNHKDGNPSNNNLDNLEWATQSENIKHSFEVLNKVSCWKGRTGKNSHCSKPVICNETGQKFDSVKLASVHIGSDNSNLVNHLKGKTKHIKNLTFKYI